MFVAAAGIAAYSTPRYKLKLMRASCLLWRVSCFFELLSDATAWARISEEECVWVHACVHGREKSQALALSCQGCWHFACIMAKLPWWCFLYSVQWVSALCSIYLEQCQKADRSSGVDRSHKQSPCKGTKCAGSLFCKNLILLICGFVYQRILNISLISWWWLGISLFLHYRVRSQWTLETCFS